MKSAYSTHLTTVVIALLVQACADSHVSREAVEMNARDETEDVELLRAEGGLVIARASADGLAAQVELLRGPERSADWQGDREIDGAYEGDVLVTDSQGRVVLVELGGDAPIDATWLERLGRPHGDVDRATRREELRLAAGLADRLSRNPKLDAEARVLARGLAGSIRATLSDYEGGAEALANAEPTPPLPATDPTSFRGAPWATEPSSAPRPSEKAVLAGPYVHQVYIRSASCCWSFGTHSATRLRVFDSGAALIHDVKTRNHGRWVDDPSMATVSGCPKSFSPRANSLPPFNPYVATDTGGDGVGGGCSTPNGNFSGEHNCNDDSLAQYSNVKFNAVSSWATCGDSTLRSSAPTCN